VALTPRVTDEAAYVLHRYDWSEASLVLEVFARRAGRVVLVAKGVKRPSSQFRPVLLPLQPLRLSWGGDAEVRTLKAAQWQGGHVMPTGDALLAGSYLNELVLRLLARDDPHPALFDHYALAVALLAQQPQAQAPVLRAFELLLLRAVGLLPELDREGSTLAPLKDGTLYRLVPDTGVRALADGEEGGLPAVVWHGLAQSLASQTPLTDALPWCAQAAGVLRSQLLHLLHYHSGVREFRTRRLMRDVQQLASSS
jgi:DNA repair protein RecO (recombination protein O)